MGSTDVLTKNTVLGNTIGESINLDTPSGNVLPTEFAIVDNLNIRSNEVQIQSYFISQMLG